MALPVVQQNQTTDRLGMAEISQRSRMVLASLLALLCAAATVLAIGESIRQTVAPSATLVPDQEPSTSHAVFADEALRVDRTALSFPEELLGSPESEGPKTSF